MSKIGGLKALFNRLLGEKGLVDVNKSMLGMQRKGVKKAADYRELSSWEDFLENEAMLPRGARLSSYAEAQKLTAWRFITCAKQSGSQYWQLIYKRVAWHSF